MKICNHCGYNVEDEPPKGVGCRHIYYPEYCKVCADKARTTRVLIDWDLSKVTTEVPDAKEG